MQLMQSLYERICVEMRMHVIGLHAFVPVFITLINLQQAGRFSINRAWNPESFKAGIARPAFWLQPDMWTMYGIAT